jgi:type 1 glutamine amidotransferase
MARIRFSYIAPAAVTIMCVSLVLADTSGARAADTDTPIRALLICGGCCHDYAKQKDILTKGISERANVAFTIAYDPVATKDHKNPVYDSPDWAKNYDVIVHDECSGFVKDPETIERILKPHQNGLPAVVLHCGIHSYGRDAFPKITPWFEFTGMPSTAHGALAPIAIHFLDESSPITKGMADWTTINEELYNNAAGKPLDTAQALARGKQTTKSKDGKSITADYVVVWTNLYRGNTRVFATTIGHNNQTVADPRYLDLITRGLLWSVDKLDDAHLKPAKKAPSEKPANQ